ncbi:MAG: Fe-S cluster assembly ATPase SufC [Chlamydiae bacterium]|nr:Fe-S cluster assembly ATPase SufC [Chlamydiota bacterium]
MLKIEDLIVEVEGKKLLQGFNLELQKGQIHVIMGPNGVGKSTLAKTLAGDPAYKTLQGKAIFKDRDLLKMNIEERSHLGLFVGFQYPIEIAGINNFHFLYHALSSKRKFLNLPPLSKEEFTKLLDEKIKLLNMKEDVKNRGLNLGFSGGEKKRNEILQMLVLDPDVAILDETDSGLDIDALKLIAESINKFMNKDKAIILITHYSRLLEYIKADFIHVMLEGKIVRSETHDFVHVLEEKGYDWLKHEKK